MALRHLLLEQTSAAPVWQLSSGDTKDIFYVCNFLR